MISTPLVSVNMPVFNGEKYIAEAIQSILHQTYSNWELIILDDGSSDRSVEIASSFTDKRIKIYQNSTNTGLAHARNKLLNLSNGEYIALLDCDDIAYPERLSMQTKFLEENKDFGLLGSSYEHIDVNSILTGKRVIFKAASEEIPIILTTQNYFAQSAVMMRQSMIPEGGYRKEYPPAEDYDLWSRFYLNCKIWNLPEVLLKYRWHDENSSNIGEKLKNLERRIVINQLNYFNINPTDEEIETHQAIFKHKYKLSLEFVVKVEKWLVILLASNDNLAVFEKRTFINYVDNLWKGLTYGSTKLGIKFWYLFKNSTLSNYQSLDKQFKILFFFKAFIKR